MAAGERAAIMALTTLQRDVCRALADRRRASGESYVAGGAALQEALSTLRLSRDIDIFHDTAQALAAAWEADRQTLRHAGYEVVVLRERPTYVEARVERAGDSVLVEWARDSAYRFFPLVEHPDFGLTLHPFDLATNKVLALVGRLEARDWIDVIECADRLQPLGYLAWAACGKDPGFSPHGILAEAGRSARYSEAEIASLAFSADPPRAADLARRWHEHLRVAVDICARLPGARAGHAVLASDGGLFAGDAAAATDALRNGQLIFHPGQIRGAFPRIADPPPASP
jgi:hypothetical protein